MDEYNAAMLLLRVAFGLTMAAHGYAKVFKGGKLDGTAGWFDSIGMKPGAVHARMAAFSEILTGLGLAVGLLTTFSAAGFVGLMVVAGYVVHRSNGFFIVSEGWEYTFILAVAAVGIAMLGPGAWSIDDAIGLAQDFDGWTGFLIAAVGGSVGGVVHIAMYYGPPQ
jgi:putative oxidoreductase